MFLQASCNRLKVCLNMPIEAAFGMLKALMVHARSMRLHHLIPFFFTAVIILLSIGGLIELVAVRLNLALVAFGLN